MLYRMLPRPQDSALCIECCNQTQGGDFQWCDSVPEPAESVLVSGGAGDSVVPADLVPEVGCHEEVLASLSTNTLSPTRKVGRRTNLEEGNIDSFVCFMNPAYFDPI